MTPKLKTQFNVTRQSDIFKNETCRFNIKDDLLFQCIGIGRGNSNRQGELQGFNSWKGDGYALLTYFASRALGFRRFPFCEDRIYAKHFIQSQDFKAILKQLDEQKIQTICNEVRAIYGHTQYKLSQKNIKFIRVRREIKSDEDRYGYAETLIRLKQAGDLLHLNDVEIEMDTLNSFGDEGLYKSLVTLELEIPVEDVFYCSCLIADRHGISKTMETGEWVVINKSPTGVVSIPTSSISYSPKAWGKQNPFDENKAQKFIDGYQPILIRDICRNQYRCVTTGLKKTILHKLASWLYKCVACSQVK